MDATSGCTCVLMTNSIPPITITSVTLAHGPSVLRIYTETDSRPDIADDDVEMLYSGCSGTTVDVSSAAAGYSPYIWPRRLDHDKSARQHPRYVSLGLYGETSVDEIMYASPPTDLRVVQLWLQRKTVCRRVCTEVRPPQTSAQRSPSYSGTTRRWDATL
jgi:hypothetical protein